MRSELSRLRDVWWQIRMRCSNPRRADWIHYGGQGIRMAPEWELSFRQFLTDVGMRPSPDHWLGRLDVTKNFEPGNVEWTTQPPQMRRRRYCRHVELSGHTVTIAEAAQALKIEDSKLRRRIVQYGRSLAEAASTAPLVRRDQHLLTFAGETLTLPQWSARVGLPTGQLWRRMTSGWPPEKVLYSGSLKGQRPPATP